MLHAVARSTRPITSIKGPQGWRPAQLSYWRQSQPPGACSRSGGGLEEGECVAFWECFLHECSSALSQAAGWWLTSAGQQDFSQAPFQHQSLYKPCVPDSVLACDAYQAVLWISVHVSFQILCARQCSKVFFFSFFSLTINYGSECEINQPRHVAFHMMFHICSSC